MPVSHLPGRRFLSFARLRRLALPFATMGLPLWGEAKTVGNRQRHTCLLAIQSDTRYYWRVSGLPCRMIERQVVTLGSAGRSTCVDCKGEQ